MKKYSLFLVCVLFIFCGKTQSFAPAPGLPGSTAIHKDSSVFVAWASEVEIVRGYLDIADKTLGIASYGNPDWALGKAEGTSVDVVSLGDSGVAIFHFDRAITDEAGADFAIFENGFADDYMELAFVEVSSDGINFQRFPAVSEIPLTNQLGPYEFSDCRYVNHLAGKYRQGFGTPFDLSDLEPTSIDLQHITHVKIVDVIGTIDSLYASRDANADIINDPYPSAFESGGFDLDALGIIHQEALGLQSLQSGLKIYPNPMNNHLSVQADFPVSISITDLQGKILANFPIGFDFNLNVSQLSAGFYLLNLKTETETFVQMISKE